MIGIVVAAHGDLAQALVTTARSVFPGEGPLEAVAITETDDTSSYEARLHAAIERVGGPAGVLVLTDMFGGTPSNVGLTLHQPGRVEVVTGANLPMLIKAMQLAGRDGSLTNLSTEVKDYGRRAIALASQVLGVKDEADGQGAKK